MVDLKRRIKETIAACLYNTGVLQLSQMVRKRFRGKSATVILCYHRVCNQPPLLAPQSVSPDRFAKQLSALSGWGRSCSLGEMFNNPCDTVRDDTFIITFDDGYADYYENARPLLRNQNLTATLFVSSAPLLSGESYWFDTAAAAAEGVGPDNLSDLEGISDRCVVECLSQLASIPACRRAGASKTLLLHLKNLPNHERKTITHQLSSLSWTARGGESRRHLSVHELQELRDEGDEIGAHTVDHCRLSQCSPEEARRNIKTSIWDLEKAGFSIRTFAYPFGKNDDIGTDAPQLVRETPVSLAVTTEERAVSAGDDPVTLPRLVVSDQSGPLLRLKCEILAWKTAGKRDGSLP